MNGFMDKLSEKILPLANALGQNRYLTVLRDAFMLSFPITMFGSIVVVLNNLPFFSDATKGTLGTLFGNGQNATMSIMTVFVTFGIGYYLSKSYDVEGIFGGAVSFASFLILTPFFMTTESGETISGVLSLDRLGAKGMFIGMIAAFLAAEIYCRITKRGWQIKMPDGVPPAVSKSFAALIPAIITLTVFLVINAIMTGVFNANWTRQQLASNSIGFVLCPIPLVLRSTWSNHRQLCDGPDLEYINVRQLRSVSKWGCTAAYRHKTIYGNLHRWIRRFWYDVSSCYLDGFCIEEKTIPRCWSFGFSTRDL
jgi:hypothetical protein